MRTWPRFAVVSFAVLSLSCVTRTDAPKALSEGCVLNSDCSQPLVCVFQRCHQQCTADKDCPSGTTCAAAQNPYSVCLLPDELSCRGQQCPGSLVCTGDSTCVSACSGSSQCHADQECVAGLCLPKSATDAGLCVVASDCPQGGDYLTCRNNRCVPQCYSQADCASDEACTRGRCVRATSAPLDGGAPACTFTSQCADGGVLSRVCLNGQCQPECLADVDCRGGLVCGNGACVEPRDGGAGSSCNFNSECRGLACVQGRCATACALATDCQVPGATCNAGVCVPPTSTNGGCRYSSECSDGGVCLAGVCGPECAANLDCLAGFECRQAKCQRVDAGTGGVDGGAPVDAGALCSLNSECPPATPRCGPLGRCVVECRAAVDCSLGQQCINARCSPLADGGQVPGFGTPCAFQSACTPFGLSCVAGVCQFGCAVDTDCPTSGQCCRTGQCVAGLACVPDGGIDAGSGSFDAGTPIGGACTTNAQCQNSDFCDGLELCRAGRCVAGTSPCEDNNPCTRDLCDNTTRACAWQSTQTDNDHDNFFPVGCVAADAGNADCDDSDNLTFPGAVERCDWKDNNCNGAVDEGLWLEDVAARGALTSSNAYPPAGGPPSAAKFNTSVVVTAASFGLRGSVDGYLVSSTDLSAVTTSPTPLNASGSQWASCIEPRFSRTIPGKQIVRPVVVASGAGFGLVEVSSTFSNAAGTCCSTTAPNETRNQAVKLTTFDGALLNASSTPLSQLVESSTGFEGLACWDAILTSQSLKQDGVDVAWQQTPGRFIATWFENRGGRQGAAVWDQRFATMVPGQPASPSRAVLPVTLPPTRWVPADGRPTWVKPARVGVGATTVMFAWVYVPNSFGNSEPPGDVPHVRFALYDAQLNSIVAGPNYYQPSTSTPNMKLESVHFDGTNYVLLVNLANGQPAQFVRVNEQAQVVDVNNVVTPALSNNDYSGSTGGYTVGSVQSSFLAPGGKALVSSWTSFAGFRFAITPIGGGSSSNVVDVDLYPGLTPPALTTRTDVTLVPLSSTRVGVVWSDGNLRKTVMKCGP